jgi:hypothetical protein
MPPAPCEHHTARRLVRPHLIPGYAEVGLTCVHGYMVDTVDRPDSGSSPAVSTSQNEHAESNSQAGW